MSIAEALRELMKQQVEQTTLLKQVQTDVRDIKITLHGKPGHEKLGLVMRVNGLEIWDKSKNKVLWLLGGTVVGGISSWLASKI